MTCDPGREDVRLGGDYVKLEEGDLGGGTAVQVEPSSSCRGSGGGRWWSVWWWAKVVVVVVFVGLSAAAFFRWGLPFLIDKWIIPLIHWERETFSITELALLIFGSVAIFPSLLVPSSPSMWIAGMSFGYGYGFLLVFGAMAIGVSLPYFIGSLFRHKIQVWLERYPTKASVIRLAGEGSLLDQCRAVTFIRISPFPYIIYNYCAVATDVKYGPYLFGTMVGMVPDIFLSLYTGILIKTLADASHEQHTMSAPQIILTVAGFCIAATTTVMGTLYARTRLSKLQIEEEPLLK